MINPNSAKETEVEMTTERNEKTITPDQVNITVTNTKTEGEYTETGSTNSKLKSNDNSAGNTPGEGASTSNKTQETKIDGAPAEEAQPAAKPKPTAPPPTADTATMSQILGTLTSFLIMPMPGFPFLRYETTGSLERNNYIPLERYAIYDGNEENYNKCPKPIFYVLKNFDRDYKETDGGAIKSFFPACKSICPAVKPTDPPAWIMLNPENGEEFAKIYRIADDARHYKIDFPNKVQLIMDRPNLICCGDTRCLPLAFYCNPAIDEHVEVSSQEDEKKIIKSNQQVLYGGAVIKNGEDEVFSNILPVDTGFHLYPMIFGCNCLGCCTRNKMICTPSLWRLKLNCIPKLCCGTQPLYEMETIKVLHGKAGRPDVTISFKNETKSSPFDAKFNANITRISFSSNSLSVEEKLASIMTEIIPHEDDEFDIGLI